MEKYLTNALDVTWSLFKVTQPAIKSFKCLCLTQPVFNCSKLRTEILEQGVNYFQSLL